MVGMVRFVEADSAMTPPDPLALTRRGLMDLLDLARRFKGLSADDSTPGAAHDNERRRLPGPVVRDDV